MISKLFTPEHGFYRGAIIGLDSVTNNTFLLSSLGSIIYANSLAFLYRMAYSGTPWSILNEKEPPYSLRKDSATMATIRLPSYYYTVLRTVLHCTTVTYHWRRSWRHLSWRCTCNKLLCREAIKPS